MQDDRDGMRAVPWVLAHHALNAVFALWTFGGSLFVLFLDELGLRKEQIGLLLALFPFCGLLALWFAPLAARLGVKRVFIAGYGLRKLAMAALVALPWVVAHGGQGTALVFLCGVVGVFALLRALAETAYYPWSQEFIAHRIRGRVMAWINLVGLAASVTALAVAGRVLASGQGTGRYLILIGAGSAIGLASVAAMLRVPGGAPCGDSAGPHAAHWARMIQALRDRNFRAYLGGLAGVTLGSGMLLAFLPLYLRNRIGLATATVVRLDMVYLAGGALASLGGGWLSDRVGSRPVLMPSAILLAVVPLGWLLLPREGGYLAGFAALNLAFGIAASGTTIAAGRLLYNGVVPTASRTAYLAVYYAWMGLAGGAAPLLAGSLLAAFGNRRMALGAAGSLDGYALLFILAACCLAVGGSVYGRVRADGVYTTRTLTRSLLKTLLHR